MLPSRNPRKQLIRQALLFLPRIYINQNSSFSTTGQIHLINQKADSWQQASAHTTTRQNRFNCQREHIYQSEQTQVVHTYTYITFCYVYSSLSVLQSSVNLFKSHNITILVHTISNELRDINSSTSSDLL
ncbi:hypothetical protein WN55_06003 [Dufourea novaeangliae]|uniref:Uncharacterized protein n=1 Tax=Dufourea novaeangliae TaxID=178035 RepID=A0A154NZE3_DUFNO|nr:hypothetical protein WN55_06003 [Dufourea novaeangliae]